MRDTNIYGLMASYQVQQRVPGFRRYEIKDHLGNVRTVISDIKNPHTTSGSITNWTYLADVRNISNMYPYGKSYPAAATYSADDDYRYGFNGMEKEKNFDDGVLDFGARFLDMDFVTFGSPDPLERIFPYQSPYVLSENNPILKIDINGEWAWVVNGIWLNKNNANIELFNQQKLWEKTHKIKLEKLTVQKARAIEFNLNNLHRDWNNPKSPSYSPAFAKVLMSENNKINILIADLSNMHGNHKEGTTPLGINTIYLNKDLDLYSQGSSDLKRVFIHELTHAMGWTEFQAYSVNFSLNHFTREDISARFNKKTDLENLLKGSDIKIKDFFIEKDNTELFLFGEESESNKSYRLKPEKEEEFWEIMESTGKETRGINSENKN